MTPTAALALVLGLLPAALAAGSAEVVSSPLLLWSNRAFVGSGEGQTVSYQSITDAEDVASKIVLGAAGKLANSGPGLIGRLLNLESLKSGATVVVFLGTQLDAADMRRGAAGPALNKVLDASASSVVLPYASSKEQLSKETLIAKLADAGVSVKAIDGTLGLAAALEEAKDGKAQVVLVSSEVSSTDDATNAGLKAEMSQLEEVQQAVDQVGLEHVFLYVSTPSGSSDEKSGGKRRSLLQATFTGFGPYTTCGTLCQTQVRWLEGMLAALVLALASCAGLVCLYVLDTPTRFEAPKDVVSSN